MAKLGVNFDASLHVPINPTCYTAATQASGEALYTLDQPVTKEGLWAAYVGSHHSLARIQAVDPSKALQLPGVVAFITAEDIPEAGANSCMGQEAVFSEGLVEYVGQPIGLIVAEDRAAAERGAQLVKVRESNEQFFCVLLGRGV